MGLFDSLKNLASKAEGLVHKAESVAGGLRPASPAAFSAPSDLSGLKDKAKKLTSWQNVLSSRVRLEVSKTPGSKMGQAVDVWTRSFAAPAQDAIADAVAQAEDLASEMAGGVTIDPADTAASTSATAKAGEAYTKAVAYAKQISDHIAADTARAAEGVTAGDVARAAFDVTPVGVAVRAYKAAPAAAQAVKDEAAYVAALPGRAYKAAADEADAVGQKITKAASAAAGVTTDWLKYAAIGLGAVAVLYVGGLARPFLPNPPRRRRR